MQWKATGRRSIDIAGVLALASIVIACRQQQTAPPGFRNLYPHDDRIHGEHGSLAGRGLRHGQADDDRISATLSEGAYGPSRRGPNPWPALAGQDCVSEWWSVSTRSPSNFGFAFLSTIRTLAPNCRVRYGIAAILQNSGPVARNGTGWSDVNQIGGIYTASFTSAGGETANFTSAGGENCKAFLKYGPPWQGGFLWGVYGWLCVVQGNSVENRDLQSFVDALIVKAPTYD